MDDPL